MAAVLYRLLPILLLTGGVSSQCFTNTDCSGDFVPADNQRECCAGTDEGLSYNVGGTCILCIGMSVVAIDSVFDEDIILFVQFMGLLKLCMMWMRMIDWTLTSDSM